MIEIAVVDDVKEDRDELAACFRKLQMEVQEDLKLTEYASGEELLSDHGTVFDLICLDIDMPGKDGIQTAREIRETDTQVEIIFITNMAQMAIKGYEVQALDFIVKPVQYYSFAMKIQNALQIIENRKSKNIIITTADGVFKVSTDNLYYVEVQGHYLYYHTGDGVLRQKAALKELEENLQGLSFERCNNCYLVNLKYVDSVRKDDVKINGTWLRISRPRKKEFLQSLADYMGGVRL